MFDIGFAELVIIGVVALIVIGPERLPDAVRTASAWLNRIRRGFNDIKQEVQQELHNDAVMKDLRTLRDTGEDLRRQTQALGSDLGNSLKLPAAKTSPGKAATDDATKIDGPQMDAPQADAPKAETPKTDSKAVD
ncbi:MAG: Sec-independent protein translocase protein TatB [Congregibacter sp.]|nr:Sec-independent protein translocase protein TatB [Congregibacter sp.]MDP5070628.1 Sec-independent protein translocase protein TatB [Congregibacter sp.]